MTSADTQRLIDPKGVTKTKPSLLHQVGRRDDGRFLCTGRGPKDRRRNTGPERKVPRRSCVNGFLEGSLSSSLEFSGYGYKHKRKIRKTQAEPFSTSSLERLTLDPVKPSEPISLSWVS